jgi:hypothetical protein
MRCGFSTGIIITTFIAFLAGCSSTPEHTNTLLFGTTTKFAFDVSVDPVGGTPDVTVGYKRHEGVWMPLQVNNRTKGEAIPAQCKKEDCSFKATETKYKENGNRDIVTEDTYSVLASFGADFSGGANVTPAGDRPNSSTTGKGGIAQFFATGIAAQKLAEKGGSRLVTVQPTDEEQLEKAEERAEVAENIQAKVINVLGEKEYAKQFSIGSSRSKKLIASKNLILAVLANDGVLDTAKWKEAVDATSLEDAIKTEMKTWMPFSVVDERLTAEAAGKGAKIIELLKVIKF